MEDFPGDSDSKASAYNVGELGLIPGSGISTGEGNGNPPQYSCLGNPMDGGAWWPTVHGVAKSWTRLVFLTSYLHWLMQVYEIQLIFVSIDLICCSLAEHIY